MKSFLATRFGFFALAAVVCAATWIPIDPGHRWVSISLAVLYGVLSFLFLLDDIGRTPSRSRTPLPAPDSPYAPPPPPGS